MATESKSLIIVGDGTNFRRLRPTVVTDIQSATQGESLGREVSGVNIDGLTGAGYGPLLSPRYKNSPPTNQRRRSIPTSDRQTVLFPTRHSGSSARTGNQKATSSPVVLLCSGKNCLDSTISAPATSIFGTVPGISNGMEPSDTPLPLGNGSSIDDVTGFPQTARSNSNARLRKANSSLQLTSVRDPLCGIRRSQNCWSDITCVTGSCDESVDYRQHKPSRRDAQLSAAAMAAEKAAQRHIWACQIPGSVKRSCRVTSGLSDLMATLNDQNWLPSPASSSCSPRRSAVKNGFDHSGRRRPSDSSSSAGHSVIRLQSPPLVVACSIDSYLLDGRSSGNAKSTATSNGRQSTTLVRGIGGTNSARQQTQAWTSTLTASNADPLLCITSFGTPVSRTGSTRLAVAGGRTDRQKFERQSNKRSVAGDECVDT